jgi:diguanylate cyclase (GGDEF)-like protein/PAS domain S-box-containing protein
MTEDKDFYKDIIDNLYDGVYFVDPDRVITYWNKGAERITGYTSEQVVGRRCSDNVLNHVTAAGVQLCGEGCPLAACMLDGEGREADVFLHHADGHRVPVLVRASPLRDAEGNVLGAVETFSGDMGIMTVRNELHELRHSVHTDIVTGIGNRRQFEGRLRGVLAELAHETETTAGLLYIDIDSFKKFNDAYGHEVGDKALRMVAATLRHNLRDGDVIGRWGGDEFLAILYDAAPEEGLRSITEKLRMLVEFCRLDLEGASLTITISIGATQFLPTDTPETVVSRADALMYRSKQAGGNRVSIG